MSADAAQRDDLGDRTYFYDHEGAAVPARPEDLALAFATTRTEVRGASMADAVNICELRRTCIRTNSLNVGETGRFNQLALNQDIQTRLAASNPSQPSLLMRVVAFHGADVAAMPQSLVTEDYLVVIMHDGDPLGMDAALAWREQFRSPVPTILVVVLNRLDEDTAFDLLAFGSVVYAMRKQTYRDTPMLRILYELMFGEPGAGLFHTTAGAHPRIVSSALLVDRELYAADALSKARSLRGVLDAGVVRTILGNYGIEGVTAQLAATLRAFGMAFTDAGALFLLDDEYAVCQILFHTRVITPDWVQNFMDAQTALPLYNKVLVAVTRVFNSAYPAIDGNEYNTFARHMIQLLRAYADWSMDDFNMDADFEDDIMEEE